MILLRQRMYARPLGPNNEAWTNLGRLKNSVRRSAQPERFADLQVAKKYGKEQYKKRLREIYSGGMFERFHLPK